MIIDLQQLFEAAGEQRPVEYELDLSDCEIYNVKPFTSPVSVKGMLRNVAGIVTLDYSVRFVAELVCDRCLSPIDREFSDRFDHVLVNRLEEDNGDFILVEDGNLDLDELVFADVLLSMPSKILCSEDCKGLCPRCGKNLNDGDCGCSDPEGDPRFDVLKQLLT